MKLICITDPTTHPEDDATFILYQRFADNADIELFHCPASAINSKGELRVEQIKKAPTYDEFLKLDSLANSSASFAEFDIAFCRTDKPYPKDYKKNLSLFEDQVRFVNRPSSLIQLSQKIKMADLVGKYMPDYIVTRNSSEVSKFLDKFEKIVAKRNVGYGGKSVYKIWLEDGQCLIDNKLDGTKSFPSIVETVDYLNGLDSDPYQYMRYLNRVHEGDKRIHVIENRILGAMLRKSSDGSWVQNTTSGGAALAVEITEREREIVETLAGDFLALGIHTMGFDFLTDDDGQSILSEVNCGNIGGYNLYDSFTDRDVINEVVQWLIGYSKKSA